MLSGLGVEMGGFAYAEFRAIYEVLDGLLVDDGSTCAAVEALAGLVE